MYKERLVAKEYSQIYSINYDETFAPIVKIDTLRMLVLCYINFNWSPCQLDVKNAFLHEDLKKEVYMEVLSRFATPQSTGKACKLKK
jgi:Reverse transcriptase (RNA-dependent DNA polymerase)